MAENKSKLEKLLEKEGLTEQEAITALKGARKTPSKRKRAPSKSSHIKYVCFSDAHIGHKEFQPELMDSVIQRANKDKVDFVVDPGDHLEGMSGRPGHIYELTHQGFSQQFNYAKQFYEQFKMPVFGIDGNHDQWFFKKNNGGVVVGQHLDDEVENYTHLGQDEGWLDIGNGNDIMLFHPGDGTAYATCFDDKTEILSENGWKLFRDLDEERVATLNKDKMLFEWQKPTHKTNQEFDGELLHFNSRTIDLMVTSNHRMFVRKYPKHKNHLSSLVMPQKSHKRINWGWQIKRADELTGCRQSWQMLRGGQSWVGSHSDIINIDHRESKNKGIKVRHLGDVPTEDMAELIAWYVTEGYIRKSQISISQSLRVNRNNHLQIIDLFRRLGFEPKARGRDSKDITVGSMELANFLIKECGSGSRTKFLPKWLKDSGKNILRIVFDTMIEGDGWKGSTTMGYKSISKQLLSDFSEIAHKLGYATSTNKDSVSVSNIQITPTINKAPEKVTYKGRIYCVSVPNTLILVRRNGKAIWSGNSYKLQKLIESFTGGEKPSIVHSGHYHKAMYAFIRNVHGFESGTLCDQSQFMRGKKIPAHMGYWVVDLWHNKEGVQRIAPEFVPHYND